MKAEHRRPLIAFVLVTLVCFGVMAHAIRTDALGGFGHLEPSRILAGSMLVPKDAAAPVEAPVAAEPVVPPTPASGDSPSADPTSPAHATTIRRHATHQAAAHQPAAAVVSHAPSHDTGSVPAAPTAPAVPQEPAHGPQHHGTDDWPGGGSDHGVVPGTGLAEGLHHLLDHDWGHEHGWDHGDHDWGHGHDGDHGYDGDHGPDDHDWGHGWGHDGGH